jgi:hypothetical protein
MSFSVSFNRYTGFTGLSNIQRQKFKFKKWVTVAILNLTNSAVRTTRMYRVRVLTVALVV